MNIIKIIKISALNLRQNLVQTLNKISELKYISELINHYKILSNYYWFQLIKKAVKFISYINLCIISVLFIYHVDYYNIILTIKKLYSESFKFVFQPIWNTITKLTNNISNDSIINQSKNGFIDSSRIREFYTHMETNLGDSKGELILFWVNLLSF
jgi:hypothetical protein